LTDPAVHKSLAGDLALLGYDDTLRRAVELRIVNTAKPHDAHTRSRLHTGPGIGTMLRLGLLYDIHDIARVPRGQDFASACRLVTCARESAGKRSGTAGAKIGNAPLTWAFAEAAVLCFRDHPAAQKLRARLAHTHGKGNALTILAHTLARAVYDLLKRQTACDLDTCLQGEGRGAGALHAELDSPGMPLLPHARYRVNACVSERP
jgi:hypothetical protein